MADMAEGIAQETLDPVSLNGITVATADGQAQTSVTQRVAHRMKAHPAIPG